MSNISNSQRATLVFLLDESGHCHVPIGIAEGTGYARETVSRGLSELSDKGYVRNKGHGVWILTEAGIEKATELREGGFTKPQ